MAEHDKKSKQDLIGTHIRLTRQQYMKLFRLSKNKKISIAQIIRNLVENI